MTLLILVIGVSLAISFLCSLLEATFLSLTHSYVALLKEKGSRAGAMLGGMRERMGEPIAAILTLNTIAHTVGASMGGALAYDVFGEAWIAAFSAALTLAILLFSEILPKTLGASNWQRLAVPTAYVLRFLIVVLKPVLIPLAWFNRLVSPRGQSAPMVSRAELEVLAEIGRREGTIDQDEWEVVSNVMNLDSVRVSQVMTPRTAVVALHVDDTIDAAVRVVGEEAHSRYPVYGESLDDIRGLVTAHELWRAHLAGIEHVRDCMRPIRFMPDSKPVETLIREMRAARSKMVVVVDEFGGTAGIATLEDLLEEIVGEIQDERDDEPPEFMSRADGRISIAGGTPLDEVSEHLSVTLPEDRYDTLGGFVQGELGRAGEVGDRVESAAGVFEIERMDGRRVERVVYAPPVTTREPGAEGEAD
jgi:putative hemolysin